MNDAVFGRPERINDLLYLTAGGPAPDPVQRINALYFLAAPPVGVSGSGEAGRQWSLQLPAIGSAGGGPDGMALGAPALLPGYTGNGGGQGDIGPVIQDALSGSRVGDWYRPVRQQSSGPADRGSSAVGLLGTTSPRPVPVPSSPAAPYYDPMTGIAVYDPNGPANASPGALERAYDAVNRLIAYDAPIRTLPQLYGENGGLLGPAVAATMPNPEGSVRGAILPIMTQADGLRRPAMPGALRDMMIGAGDLLDGTKTGQITPEATLALAAMLGAGPGGRAAAETAPEMASALARKPVKRYPEGATLTPKPVDPRPFSADYPSGVQTDAAGKILADIEGRPLTAPTIVGRQRAGAADIPLPMDFAEATRVAEALSQKPVEWLPLDRMRTAEGRVRGPEHQFTGTGADLRVQLRNDLVPGKDTRVLYHENGHLIDQIAGEIPIDGLTRELIPLYDKSNTAIWSLRPSGPTGFGYSRQDAPREMMVEAIRAYMADPNYLKSVAPETAKRIRAYVNTNPRLSQVLQFNLGGPLEAAVAGYAAESQKGGWD